MNQGMTAIQDLQIQDPLLHIEPTKEITLKFKNAPPGKMTLQGFNIEDTINHDESMYTDELYSQDERGTNYNKSRRVAAKLSN